MSASRLIDNIQFSLIKKLPKRLKARINTWEVEGLDGYGAEVLGLGHGDFDLVTVLYAENDAVAEDHIDRCVELQKRGSIVTIIDAFENVYDNCLVVEVDDEDAKQTMIWKTNPLAVRVQLTWKFLRTA